MLQARVLLRIKDLAGPLANLLGSKKYIILHQWNIWQEGWQQKHQAVQSDQTFWVESYHQLID